jgi:hypothetical protein
MCISFQILMGFLRVHIADAELVNLGQQEVLGEII